MVGGLAIKSTGIVLSAARQRWGAMPSVVTLHDFSRFHNDGAMTDVTWVQLPSGLWVMSFNGATSFVDFGNDPSFDFGLGDFALELWIRTTQTAWGTLADKRDGGAGWWRWTINAGGNLNKCYFETNTASMPSLADVNDGVFHDLLFVRSGDDGRLYVDGQLDNTDNGYAAWDATNPAVLSIGSLLPKHDSAHYDGLESFVRAYSYALTPAQIRAKFTATRGFFGV